MEKLALPTKRGSVLTGVLFDSPTKKASTVVIAITGIHGNFYSNPFYVNIGNTLSKAGIDFIRNGADNHLPGNISISIKNASGEMLLHRLDLKGICISTGSACDSVNTQVSHVIQAIAVPEDYAAGTIRISFGRDNQESDAQEIADAIVNILQR